jgi:ParB/RepB/Spo0J family partition protein
MQNTEIVLLPLTALQANPWNRKTFSTEKLRELADSIAANGIVEPLIVRPLPPVPGVAIKFPTHEIIAGERRWRAAAQTALSAVPCLVRECTDQQARQITAIENLQREDLSAVEEAISYQALLTESASSVDDLVAIVGKKRSHIYASLRLLKLPKNIQNAVIDGKLEASVAGLLATIPDPKQQAAALKDILETGPSEFIGDAADFDYTTSPKDYIRVPLSFRQAKRRIEAHYRANLDGVLFDTTDPSLGAVACIACPKRTGNLVGLPAGTSPNVCTDPACLKAKTAACREALLTAELAARVKRKSEVTGISAATLDKEWQYGALKPGSKFFGGVNGKSWEADNAKITTYVGIDPKGRPVTLHLRAELEAAGVIASCDKSSSTMKKPAELEEDKRRAERDAASLAAVVTAVLVALVKASNVARVQVWSKCTEWLLRFNAVDFDVIVARRGWPSSAPFPEGTHTAYPWQDLMVEMLLTGYRGYEADKIAELAKLLKVDAKSIASKEAKKWDAQHPPAARRLASAPADAKAMAKPITKKKK